ncbi:MAG TPA: type II secretion system protein GspD [Candidatus Omnitrophica bacterium]|nr:type II secretion system protein GspD [Candidatus Omnitrophota bacterium]
MRKKSNLLKTIPILLLLLLSTFICYKVEAQNKTITIVAENKEISDILYEIAEAANMNLVISKDVIGKVTVKLIDVSLDKALKTVLQPNNLTYTIEDDVITVYTYAEFQQQERFSPLKTRVFTLENVEVSSLRRVFMSMKSARGKVELNLKGNQVIITDTAQKIKEIEGILKEIDKEREVRKYRLRYADAEDIKEKLLQVIPEETGEVFVDERTNSVVIKAASPLLKNIDELIEGWDIQHQQVLIEAKILQVTLDKEHKLGIDWNSSLNLRQNISMDLTEGSSSIFKVATLTADEYEITLKMLETQAETEVLSSPRVVVIDNHEANILVGSSEPYIETTKDPDTGWLTEETKFKDVGLKLIVTPKIGEDNFVTITVHPEVSTARRVTEVDNALAVDTTQADTTMMVKDGETVVLGGLMKDVKSKTIRKVPLLGDIPLLGYLFRSKERGDKKTELVVFITPHILTDRNRESLSYQDIEATVKRSETTFDVLPQSIRFEQE